jgi:hypothetical protein
LVMWISACFVWCGSQIVGLLKRRTCANFSLSQRKQPIATFWVPMNQLEMFKNDIFVSDWQPFLIKLYQTSINIQVQQELLQQKWKLTKQLKLLFKISLNLIKWTLLTFRYLSRYITKRPP